MKDVKMIAHAKYIGMLENSMENIFSESQGSELDIIETKFRAKSQCWIS